MLTAREGKRTKCTELFLQGIVYVDGCFIVAKKINHNVLNSYLLTPLAHNRDYQITK